MQINLELDHHMSQAFPFSFIYKMVASTFNVFMAPWLLTWPDLKEKDEEGRTR
jgi:hypothetical protein